MYIIRLVFIPLLSVLLLSLAACTTSSSQFYMLEPITGIEHKSPTGITQKPVIILSPVRIPHYVDRPQIVTANGKNAYQLNELNRWAEALDHNIGRVLAQNLTIMVPAEVGFSSTSTTAERANFRVSVNILEFHADPQGQAGLTAQWQITRSDGALVNRQVSYRAPASTSDYRIIVEALNDCLNRLSRDLADEVRRLADDKSAINKADRRF
ncbi:PqiC family protein [Methylobacter sp.]|uniref:PqiC family protein n=1 Tax=Methylobacter sp. TaxID=2051955 RepID=UPI00120400A2|nr:PqiC family protein [Methylobacter sp.]TAK62087.1 MAG: membrane integrity-associated transporter subunit PqiC [Methylobacter sp.]